MHIGRLRFANTAVDMDAESLPWGATQDDVDAWGGEEDEEYEVEDVADDMPMRIADRVFLGSIDAARNTPRLRAANIGVTLALLGADDERVHVDNGDNGVTRVMVEMEDSLDEPLFMRLPALIAKLEETLEEAKQRDCNVLVHCMAGRSRSPSLVAAWLTATNQFTLEAALSHIELVRPWVDINKRFRDDLRLFDQVLRHGPGLSDVDDPLKGALVSRLAELPRLDFGASLVADILSHKKAVTMRLASDVVDDANSDLGRIFQYLTVVATSGESQTTPVRDAFAFLRVDRVVSSVKLAEVDSETLVKTGFASHSDVLRVLQTFYPHVTIETPLLIVHFTCLTKAA